MSNCREGNYVVPYVVRCISYGGCGMLDSRFSSGGHGHGIFSVAFEPGGQPRWARRDAHCQWSQGSH